MTYPTLAQIASTLPVEMRQLPAYYRLQHQEANTVWEERRAIERERREWEQAMRSWDSL